MHYKALLLVVISALSGFSIAQQPHAKRTINVLWYSYAHPESNYRRSIDRLAQNVHAMPQSAGLAWRLSWYGPDWPPPKFERYDVLVIQSGEAFHSGDPTKNEPAKADFSGILKHRAAIGKARGSRTVLTGSDADLHAIMGDTGNAPAKPGHKVRCNPPMIGRACWDGAVGHAVNAVNWAASGRGLGVVSFVAAEFPGSDWWLKPESFLREEFMSAGAASQPVTVFGPGTRENSPVIPSDVSTHALNAGLTSKGLGNWTNSFHAGFSREIRGYFAFVNSTRYPDLAMAIASDRERR